MRENRPFMVVALRRDRKQAPSHDQTETAVTSAQVGKRISSSRSWAETAPVSDWV